MLWGTVVFALAVETNVPRYKQNSGCEAVLMYFRHLALAGERRSRLTRGGEEGSPQPVVGGDLADLCSDVDESTHHRRDPVEAQ